MLPTLHRDVAVVDDQVPSPTTSSSTALDGELLTNYSSPLITIDRGGGGGEGSVNGCERTVVNNNNGFISTLLQSIYKGGGELVSTAYSRSPSARSCVKKVVHLWKKKMLVLSKWMDHMANNWKATLRYVFGKLRIVFTILS